MTNEELIIKLKEIRDDNNGVVYGPKTREAAAALINALGYGEGH